MTFYKPIRIKNGVIVAVLIAALSCAAPLASFGASVPNILSYQGRLADASGNLLGAAGTSYYFKFSIWDNPTVGSGSRLWPTSVPTSVALTVRQGVFVANIGDTAAGYPDTLDYDFSTDTDIYLQVEVSSDNVSFQTLSPRQRVSAAPFAQLARSVSGTLPSSFGTTTPFANTVVSIESTSVNATPLLIQALASQVANLFTVRSSSGAHLFSLNSSGGLFASSTMQTTGAARFYSTLQADGNATFGGVLNVSTTTATSTFSGGLSVNSLQVASLVNCDTIDTDSSGFLKCGSDSGAGSGSPGGNDTYVQFNDGGLFGGDAGFTYNKTDDRLTVTNASTTALTVSGTASTSALIANSFTLGNLTGFLKATAGAVTTSAISLVSDITGTLTVGNGGTGAVSFTAGNLLYGSGTGALQSVATTSVTCAGTVSCSGFTVIGSSPVTITGSGGGSSNVATSTGETAGQLAYWTSTNGTPATLGKVSTSSFAVSSELSYSGALGSFVGGSGGTLSLATNGVALGKIAQIGANTILGNPTGSTGNVQAFATSTLGIAISDTTGTLAATRGGTGLSTVTNNQLLLGGAGNTWTQVATSSLGLLTTNVAEGSNLYYTDARVQSFVHGSTTIPKTYTGNTFTGAQVFSGGITIGSLNGPLQANAGVVSATTSVGVLYGGTGLTSAPTFGQLLVGNSSGGYTLTATSSLGMLTTNVSEGSNLYYTDARARAAFSAMYPVLYSSGTGAFSLAFGTTTSNTWAGTQTFTNILTTTATTTFLGLNSETFSDLTGSGLTITSNALTLDRTGDWTGTFDGSEGSFYLANSFSTTSADYWKTQNNFFSTTSADYWETQQTARSADDLTNNSIEDLSDVAAMTENFGDLLHWNGSAWSDLATSSLGVAIGDTTGTLAQSRGGTGLTAYAAGDIIYADNGGNLARLPVGSAGQVLKISSGLPAWGTDVSSGGGGAGAWATTTDSLAIYPADTSDVVIVGSSATTTASSIFEVFGTSYFSNTLGIATTAPSTAFKLSVQGNGLFSGNVSLANLTATGTVTTANLSLGSLNGPLQANAGVVSATTSIGVLYGGTGLTAAPTYGQLLVGNASGGYTLTATSSLGLLTTNVAEGTNLYYTDARVQSFVHSSTTIPKTYTSNTFGGTQTFSNAPILSSLTGLLKANGASALTAAVAGTDYENPLTFTYPLARSTNTISLAFGTTTANTWGAHNIFTSLFATNASTTNATTTTFALGSDYLTDLTGSGLTITGNALTLDRTGDWTGTFDGQEGSFYLANSFSTTSADYWETQQTARSADDLTNNSIEDLSDVAAMTENFGDLLHWNGSAWSDLATSSLGIAISDTTGTLTVSRGGTGATTFTAGNLLYGAGSGALQSVATTTVSCAGNASCTSFTVIGSSPVTITGAAAITAIGPAGQTQTGATITIASSTSSFNGLTVGNTIVGSGNTLTWTPSLSGTLNVAGGGTGLTSVSDGRLVLGSSATALTSLATSTGGTILQTSFTTGRPSWVATSTLGIAIADTTGTLSVARGGTGATSFTAGSLIYGAGSGALQIVATTSVSCSGTTSCTAFTAIGPSPITITGAAAITAIGPTGQTADGPTVTIATSTSSFNGLTTANTIVGSGDTLTFTPSLSGTLNVQGGGTGLTSVSDGRLILGSTATALTSLATSTGGTILQTSFTTGRPSWAATSTLGIAISDTTGTLTVARGGTGQTTFTSSQLLYGNGTNGLSSVATSTFTVSGPFTVPATLGALVGGSNTTITYTGLATTTQPSSSNLLVSNGGAGVYGVATSSATCSTGVSCTAFTVIGSAPTITNTGVLSVQQSSGSAQTGALTLATSTATTFNGLTVSNAITNSGTTFTFAPNTISGTLNVQGGGTGLTSVSDGRLLLGSSATALTSLATSTGGTILQTSFTTGRPSWVATSTLGIAIADTTGTLAATRGGTATTTFYSGGLVFSDSTKLTQAAGSGNGILHWDNTNNRLGIGTSTPWAQLSVNAGAGASDTLFAIGSSTATQFVVKTINGFIPWVGIGTTSPTADERLSVSGSAYFDIAESNFTLYNSASQTTIFQVDNGSQARFFTTGGNVSIGTTTPWGMFAINPNAITGPSFVIGSSSATHLVVTNSGLVGVGTSTPGTLLSLGNTGANTVNISATATSTFGSGINLRTGCFAVNGTCVGGAAGTLAVSGGGTGSTTLSGILLGDGTNMVRTLIVGNGLTFNGTTISAAGGSGILSIGPAGQLQTGASIGIASSTSSFNGLTVANTIVGSGDTLTWTPSLSGTLQVGGGGTGLTSVADGALVMGNSATALTSLATSTGGTILQTSLTTGRPIWVATSTLNIAIGDTTGTLALSRGGTATTTFYSGGVVFSDGTKLTQSAAAANFFWDETNKRLGLGTSTPGSTLSVNGVANLTTATSTFYSSGGINLAGGCFAVNGTCVGGGGGGGVDGANIDTFTTNDTWTKSNYSGLKFTQVITTGAGGGGGGVDGDTTSENAAGGGGAGGTAIEMIAAASLGATETVTVSSAGGTAGSNTGGTGGTGGNSSFGAHNTGNGGVGGLGKLDGVAGSGAGGAGGTATGGDMNITGGGGGTGDVEIEVAVGGVGGASYWGGGGEGAADGTASAAGTPGEAYGSGGGGAALEDTATGAAGGAGAGGVVMTINYTSTAGDLAEWYDTVGDVEAGDVVALSNDNFEYDSKLGLQEISILEKARSDESVVGIVSTAPHTSMGADIMSHAQRPRPIALAGRVPVKFTSENGQIRAGDLMTVSRSVPGAAMRSTKAGAVVGRALETKDCPTGDTCTLLVMVHTTYSTGALLKVALRDSGVDLEAIPNNVDVGRVILGEMIQKKRDFMASTSLSEIFTDRVVAALEVVAPRVVTETLVAGAIEALEDDVRIRVADDGSFVIERVFGSELTTTFGGGKGSGEILVHIDDLGNALFTGSLKAANLEIGSADVPSGITMYDTETGEPYCTRVTRGELVTKPGRCELGNLNPLLRQLQEEEESDPPPEPADGVATTTDPGAQPDAGTVPGDTTGEGGAVPELVPEPLPEPVAPPEEPPAPALPDPPPEESPPESPPEGDASPAPDAGGETAPI